MEIKNKDDLRALGLLQRLAETDMVSVSKSRYRNVGSELLSGYEPDNWLLFLRTSRVSREKLYFTMKKNDVLRLLFEPEWQKSVEGIKNIERYLDENRGLIPLVIKENIEQMIESSKMRLELQKTKGDQEIAAQKARGVRIRL